ncbi:MAG: hypothetical protein K1X71_12600 [Pirellulales bacterium]|nr:hypothetical protein [Pirellulales bacterium]
MRLSPWALSLALVAATLAAPRAQAASIQYLSPFGSSFGIAYGVDGKNVVGESNIGWWYDGSAYHVIQPPGGFTTIPHDISGNKIVGWYTAGVQGGRGFLYDGSTYTTISHPLGVNGTSAWGIDGNRIVGQYDDANKVAHGFLFDGATYTTIDHPLGTRGTFVTGIDQQNIVGTYLDSQGKYHGFLFDGTTYTTLDDTYLGGGYGATIANGIDGDRVVGYASIGTGQLITSFIYDGATYTHPLGEELELLGAHHFRGISGNRIVGEYNDQPFIYTIPEPASLALALCAALALPLVRWRSHSRSSPA